MKLVSSSFFFFIGIGLNLPIVKISDATTVEPITTPPEQTSVVGNNNQVGQNHGDPQSETYMAGSQITGVATSTGGPIARRTNRIAQEAWQNDLQTGRETKESFETTNDSEIRKCIKQSEEETIETYDKIIKNFTKETNVRALNPRLHTVMAVEFFKPCPVYIAEVPKFQNYFKIDKKFVFQRSLREMGFKSFKPEVIYRQALESSSWESEIAEHFPTNNQIGNDSKEQLNDIVGNLYKEFQKAFADIYRKKIQGVPDLPSKLIKASAINIEECDEAKNNCLNLVGILQLLTAIKSEHENI